jgi:P-type E1-E2 ATPase
MALEDENRPKSEQGNEMKKWLTKKENVFARITPPQKYFIVKSCKEMGEIVAATGDGIGDSNVLKIADVGFAMGVSSSDTAQEAADAILLRDDFSDRVSGI